MMIFSSLETVLPNSKRLSLPPVNSQQSDALSTSTSIPPPYEDEFFPFEAILHFVLLMCYISLGDLE